MPSYLLLIRTKFSELNFYLLHKCVLYVLPMHTSNSTGKKKHFFTRIKMEEWRRESSQQPLVGKQELWLWRGELLPSAATVTDEPTPTDLDSPARFLRNESLAFLVKLSTSTHTNKNG